MRLLFLLLLLITAHPHAAVSEESGARVEIERTFDPGEKDFREELSLVARKAAALGQKRFSKIRNINDSYQLTAKAIKFLSEQGNKAAAIPLLREASEEYDGNRMAYLLLGWIFERAGDRSGAARSYGDFYRYSLTTVPFEKDLIGPSSLRVFCGYVEKRFREWRLPPPKARVGLDLQMARSAAILERSPAGRWINLILPILVAVSSGLVLLVQIRHFRVPGAVSYFGISFYLLLVAGYMLWAAHFFLGLPFFVSLETENALFFGGGTALIALVYAANHFLDSRPGSKDADSKTCPHCRAFILRISTECPVCKRPCRS